MPPSEAPAPVVPPVPEPRPHVTRVHGIALEDEYHWLRDRDDPAVLAHLEAENRYTEAVLAPAADLRERLFAEFRGRLQEDDASVPVPDGGWLYYSRTVAGRQYRLHCRRRDEPGAPEELLLDENALAEGHAHFRLGALDPSPDHGRLAYATDTTGDEVYTLRVLDLATREHLPDVVERASGSVEWTADGAALLVTLLDERHRPWRVIHHRLGADPAAAAVVHEEADPAFFVHVARARSRDWYFIQCGSHSTSEVRACPAGAPVPVFTVVAPRRHGIEYAVAHHGDRFWIVTNDGHPEFRLMSAPAGATGAEHWREELPPLPGERLDHVEAFAEHLVLWLRRDGLPRLRVLDLATRTTHEVAFPEAAYTAHPADNRVFATDTVRFVYSSLVTPGSVVAYGLRDRSWTVLKRQPVLGGFDPDRYRTERLLVPAADGARVPVSLVYRLPRPAGGERPLLLVGYGAYGSSLEPHFRSTWVSLLDRGFTVALAHVRGGEELGRAWYEQGRLAHKANTFGDFIAVAEALVRDGWTRPATLAIEGGSAGGLLIGAVLNRRPALFGAAVAEVPFVDVLNTMLDDTLPLTVIEYDEWGDPRDPEAFARIRDYSPCDNVADRPYPPILATGGLHDPRVGFWEPAKWVARLRARSTSGHPVLLKTDLGAGHGGASGRYDHLRELAFNYAFVLHALEAA